ncbi:MAG: hypothetical protein ACQKBY_10260, partial [Verrucomicrobiales bacterium]
LRCPPKMRPQRKARLLKAVKEAATVKAEDWPKQPPRQRHRKDKHFDERLKVIMDRRNELAEELGIDSSVIAPRATLETIVGGRGTPEELLLNWQRDLLMG